jgi:hypothetical protein
LLTAGEATVEKLAEADIKAQCARIVACPAAA